MAGMSVQLALFTALLFIIISSQPVYKITNGISSSLVQLRLADAAGNPTRAGLVVHAIVFFAVVYGFARLNRV
jgi:hypothetical protein